MELLNEYQRIKSEIFDYFGYEEDWRVIPIDDRRDAYWALSESEDVVGYSPVADQVLPGLEGDYGEAYYEDEIYTQRHLNQYVYRAEKYTMICVDTHTDGNKFLAIYSNQREVGNET